MSTLVSIRARAWPSQSGMSCIGILLLVLFLAQRAWAGDDDDVYRPLRLSSMSSRPELVTGGDTLLAVDVAPRISLDDVRILLGGRDITTSFHTDRAAHILTGVVSGLKLGNNRIEALARGKDGPHATLELTNHPIAGPLISGSHQQPFICQTQTFRLTVTGVTLGVPLDADCSTATRVDYVYMNTSGTLQPLPDPSRRPSDLARTTTKDGRSVNYIVRVETGTINRAVYRIAVLHDPLVDAPPDPWHRPAGWNGGLLYAYGGGCGTGHHQGTDLGIDSDVLNSPLTGNGPLGLGYAMAAASLNVFGTNCDDVISAETTMMVKEHFIKQFGGPRTTIGVGASGGSMQVHLVAFNYPGLLDGIIPERSFPDTVTFEEPYQDCDLLLHAFAGSPLSWTTPQKAAVAGVQNLAFCTVNVIWGKLIQPSAVPPLPLPDVFPGCDVSIPPALRYDPITNPTGIRCTLYDDMVNVYGRDPRTGFARRTIDNVGVQYGLNAVNAGTISWDQFLDLNRRIGGFDLDGNYIPTRTIGDRTAIRIAYESGRLNSGAGLDRIPIIDVRPYLDASGNVHDDVRSFVMRARLMKMNGNADNQVIVTADPSIDIVSFYSDRILQMDEWLTNIAQDTSHVRTAQRVARNKPGDLIDSCYTAPTVKITDPATCNRLYPPSLEPRLAAGEPLTDDVIKCNLRPVSVGDYVVQPNAAQLTALRSIFPDGVCDYGRRGAEQRPAIGTWLEYPAPGQFEPVGEARDRDRD